MSTNSSLSPEQALTLALTLAITAPSDEKAAQCVAVAQAIAATLTDKQVEACKADALKKVKDHA
jgi:hypothetical protein